MVTLRQVAERAGVSVKTVSRIVNDDPAVRGKTRDSVLAVVRDMNYVPNEAARIMRMGASSVVGLMTDAVATTPYPVDIVRGAQAELKLQKKTLLIANTDGEPDIEREYWRMFRAHNVSGVIYATMYHRPLSLGQPEFRASIVLANCFAENGAQSSIVPDDEAGGYVQAEHLDRKSVV